MNLLRLFLLPIVAALSAGTTGAQTPAAPILELETNGPSLTISWSKSEMATGYTLYYAPYPEPAPIYL